MSNPADSKMPALIIKGMLYFFFVIAVITGPLGFITGTALVPESGAVTPSLDNEFRFFSVYWFAYGMLCFYVAFNLDARKGWVPALAAVMLLSGLARVTSVMMVGRPLDQYFYGAAIELVFPVIMILCYRKLSRS
jgi:Domain of unknown function (DUF4345)